MEVALRTNQDCFNDAACRVYRDAACYGPTGWFIDYCRDWRAFDPNSISTGIAKPLPVGVPNIDLTAPSIDTPVETVDDLIARNAQANADQYRRFIEGQAAANNALGSDACGAFTQWNATKQVCEFTLGSPGSVVGLIVGGIVILSLLSYLKR